MKSTEFKWHVNLLVIVATILSTNAWAEDFTAKFMETCIRNRYSRSFCECALKNFAEDSRKQRKEQLRQTIDMTKRKKELILSDPTMSKEKFDAVLTLHKKALECGNSAAQALKAGDKEKSRELTAKKRDLMTQKLNLLMSYKNVNGQIRKELMHGVFCDMWCNLDRSKKELAEIDNSLFPGEKREVERLRINGHFYNAIIAHGFKTKCN